MRKTKSKLGVAGIALTLLLSGCGWMQAHPNQIGKVEKDEFACVLKHFAEGASVETTAIDCGGLAVQDVIDLFILQQKAGTPRPVGAPPITGGK